MFLFLTRYLGFLKSVPTPGWAFDGWMKLWVLIIKPEIPDWMDLIETEVLTWENTTSVIHKYGGMQFNYRDKEIGHIHSNGLLDMLLSRSLKESLMQQGRMAHHHSFINTGWISCYMHNADDKAYALKLLPMRYQRLVTRSEVVNPMLLPILKSI